jgi:signal transduction histidine kinase
LDDSLIPGYVKTVFPFNPDNSDSVTAAAEKALFDEIINNSRSMISIINRNYVYERVNDTFCREHQIESISVVGKSLDEVWGSETFHGSIKNRLDSCFEGETVRYEASFMTPRLGQRFYEVVFRPLVTGNNGITHLIAETFDIHDLRHFRLEAIARQEELRKFELFAKGIAHDFNNILATISGYSEILRDDIPVESPLSGNVDKMISAILKAQSVVDKLLRYSHIEGQDKALTDVTEILNETIRFIKSSLSPDMQIISRITGNEAVVLADPVQLFRVFLNILKNAIQAMEDTGGTLTVSMSVSEGRTIRGRLKTKRQSDKYVVLTFSDTGRGIEKSNMRRIFEPFFSVRDGNQGTGLGLPVIQEIVQEMDGGIKISSHKGKGTVFFVYLPVADRPAGI